MPETISTEPAAAVSGDRNAIVAEERARISAILESPEGRRNPNMAAKLALYSWIDAETAISILADAPAQNPFLEAMNVQGPTGVGASTISMTNDPKAARRAEIEESVKAFNESRGYTKKQG